MDLDCILQNGLCNDAKQRNTEQRAPKTYGKAQVWFYLFFNSTLDSVRFELQIHASGHPGNIPGAHCTRNLMCPRFGATSLEKK